MGVIAVIAGWRTTLVVSSRPPSPVSSNAMSAGVRLKARKAAQVATSKNVIGCPHGRQWLGGRRQGGRRAMGFAQQRQDAGQGGVQFAAPHDLVDHAVLVEIFGALEPLRQFLADRLLDDAGAGKTDDRPRLG